MTDQNQSQDIVTKNELLDTLRGLGEIVSLNISVDQNQFENELNRIPESSWRVYNPRKPIHRHGLSLTSLDGSSEGIPDLDSIREFNQIHGTKYFESDFSVPTKWAEHFVSLHPILKMFGEDLGRSHLIRLGSGGFFPFHRDNYFPEADCVRLFCALKNSHWPHFCFVMDHQVHDFPLGRLCYFDSRKVHSVFSFVDNCIQLVLNIKATESGLKKVLHAIQIK